MDNSVSKILGIIPARAGSKRLKNKNMLPIDGVSLVERSYETLKKSKCNNVIVPTDIPELLENRSIYTMRRPDRLNNDEASVWDVVKYVIGALYRYDIIVLLFATNPLIDYTDVDRAIDMVINGGFNIVRSYNFNTGHENGLYAFKREQPKHLFDVYTGSLNVAGEEIHTEEEYNLIRSLIENVSKSN